MDFESPAFDRGQMILFAQRLDDAIAPDHGVRLLDSILGRVDWKPWEKQYKLRHGRPPIHPRIVAAAILYGIQKRIRTSRALEEALQVRIDFRWLVHGRAIDHTTLSNFRTSNADLLKNLFIQVVLIAKELGHLPLQSLGFDGTKMRSNNRRTGTRTPEQLRRTKAELAERFDELQRDAESADRADDELFGENRGIELSKELADVQRRQKMVDAALEELKKIEESGLATPARLPITDPESRFGKNKEGGFAPNYTPTATVDVDSGLAVDADVVFGHHEDRDLLPTLDRVKENLNLDEHPGEVLADGLMSNSENIKGCLDRGIDFNSPISLGNDPSNSALRDDLKVPVVPENFDKLPTRTTKKRDGQSDKKLTKDAFVYVVDEDCYYCPEGQTLDRKGQATEKENGREVVRHRYESSPEKCVGCPLLELCLNAKTGKRQIRHVEDEPVRLEHATKMSGDDAKKRYARRRHPGERPFAIIKQHFGARQFLLRGREKVRQEWSWLMLSFNLHRLMFLVRSNVDPPTQIL